MFYNATKQNFKLAEKTMEAITTNSINSGILTLIVLFSGIWLMKTGEPYKKVVFAVHKIGIAALTIFLLLIIIRHLQLFSFSGLGLTFFILLILFYVIAFVSGAMLSFENTARIFLKTIHKISSVLMLIMVPVIWLYCH